MTSPLYTRARQTRSGLFIRALFILIIGGLILWGVGFAWFMLRLIPAPPVQERPDYTYEGVAVLTGGSLRIEEGLKALSRGWAKQLFISGVYQAADVRELLAIYDHDPQLIFERIELGHTATNTVGNAKEIADWAQANGYPVILMITAAYHVPRSLLELERAAPTLEVDVWPVYPAWTNQAQWYQDIGPVFFLAGEYSKYLVARVRFQAENILSWTD